MKSNFDRCMAELFAREGGYVNDPRDPGGETNLGISKRSYPRENIPAMTKERAAYLYRRDYWNRVKGDDLPAGLDLVAFDAAVNSGVSRGAKWLQGALSVPADGVIGSKTIAAAMSANVAEAIDRACDARLEFMRTARHPKTGNLLWPTYKNGWTRRVEGVRNLAKSMANAPPAVAPSPSSQPASGGAFIALAVVVAIAILALLAK